MRASIVVDLGFGDAGKGLTVDWLCGDEPASSLVVRFGGGHQVGHTVCRAGRRHSFSNFGSGSLLGVPSWYAAATVVFPPAIIKEAAHLAGLNGDGAPVPQPRLCLHPLAQVCTPWDIAWNRCVEKLQGHGSCGVGFGATVERGRAGIPLHAKDLAFDWVLRHKLEAVRGWYHELAGKDARPGLLDLWESESAALDAARVATEYQRSLPLFQTCHLHELLDAVEHLILEGHQGIMLDMDHGIFPHVTWSSCTSAAALELLASLPQPGIDRTEIFYVTRCYQTRHGAGPMSAAAPVSLLNSADESNVENPHQGPFRTGELDGSLLTYALASDRAARPLIPTAAGAARAGSLAQPLESLMVTCLDQRPDFDAPALAKTLATAGGKPWHAVYGSFGPSAQTVRRLL